MRWSGLAIRCWMIIVALAAPLLALIAQRESHPVVAIVALMGTIAVVLFLPVMILLPVAARDWGPEPRRVGAGADHSLRGTSGQCMTLSRGAAASSPATPASVTFVPLRTT